MVRPLHLAWALLLGACFTANFAAGLPCSADADCGPELRCEAGVCGGPSGQATSTTTAATTTTTTSATDDTTAAPPTTDPPTTGTTGDGCGIGRCKDFDFLFILDNSPSMLIKQLLLLDFVQTFGNVLIPELSQACSVHVGVATTDGYERNPEGCRKRGALVLADNNGEPCAFVEGTPYATKADLAQPLSLQCMFDIGTEGSTNEQPVDTLFTAVGNFDPTLVETCNAGFYRPEAFLTALILTDEDDDNNDAQGNSGSNVVLEMLWNQTLQNIKATDDLYLVGLLGDPADGEPACSWDPLAGDDGVGYEQTPKLRAFIESWPAEKRAIDTLCNRVPGGNAYLAVMEEIRAEIRAACGA